VTAQVKVHEQADGVITAAECWCLFVSLAAGWVLRRVTMWI
jgi:hypothetical protein